jgi:hypothetical protein
MGHPGEQTLKKTMESTTGMRPILEDCICDACVRGRMRGGAHKRPMKRGINPLEFIYTDICGKFPVTGVGGAAYWVTFIDDFTQIAEAYPIASKSEFFTYFRRFLLKWETTERRCRRVRLDWGGENRI